MPLAVERGGRLHGFRPGFALILGKGDQRIALFRIAPGNQAQFIALPAIGADDLHLAHIGGILPHPMLHKVRLRHRPAHIALLVKGQNGFKIGELRIVENAHPFVDKPAVFLELRQGTHRNDRDDLRKLPFPVEGLEFVQVCPSSEEREQLKPPVEPLPQSGLAEIIMSLSCICSSVNWSL